MPEPSSQQAGGPDPDDGRSAIDERIGRTVLGLPLFRSAMERPEAAAPWVVLGLVLVVTWLVEPRFVLLVLLLGLPAILFARLLAAARRPRGRRVTGSPLRLALIVVWVLAILGALFLVAMVDLAAGDTGFIRFIGWFVVLLVAGIALRWVFRS